MYSEIEKEIYRHIKIAEQCGFTDRYTKQNVKQIIQIANMIQNKQIPHRLPHCLYNNYSLPICSLREIAIHNLGFVMFTWRWINELSKWIGNRKCLEVMSGTGALSYALQKKGIDIIATDDYSWQSKWKQTTYTNVENIDAIEAVKKYGKDVEIIILSWGYMDDTSYKVLKQMHETNPNCVMLFIGESEGGCTANDNFFENIIDITDYSFRKVEKEFFRWNGIHDFPRIVKYKER